VPAGEFLCSKISARDKEGQFCYNNDQWNTHLCTKSFIFSCTYLRYLLPGETASAWKLLSNCLHALHLLMHQQLCRRKEKIHCTTVNNTRQAGTAKITDWVVQDRKTYIPALPSAPSIAARLAMLLPCCTMSCKIL